MNIVYFMASIIKKYIFFIMNRKKICYVTMYYPSCEGDGGVLGLCNFRRKILLYSCKYWLVQVRMEYTYLSEQL